MNRKIQTNNTHHHSHNNKSRHDTSSIYNNNNTNNNNNYLQVLLRNHYHCRIAIIDGNYKKLSDLLSKRNCEINYILDHIGINDSYRGMTLLEISIIKNRIDMVKLILNNGGGYSLYKTNNQNNQNNNNTYYNKNKKTLLIEAMFSCSIELIRYLLEFNDKYGEIYNPNYPHNNLLFTKDSSGLSPLDYCISQPHSELLKLFLSYGAHSNLTSDQISSLQYKIIIKSDKLFNAWIEGEKLLNNIGIRLFTYSFKQSKAQMNNNNNSNNNLIIPKSCMKDEVKVPTTYRFFVSHRLFDRNLIKLIFDFIRPGLKVPKQTPDIIQDSTISSSTS